MSRLHAEGLRLEAGQRLLCEGLNLTLQGGDCLGILGPNGSGKTTLLHCLAGLRLPEAGTVTLDEMALHRLTRRQIAQRLGLLLQEHHDPFPATVLETALSGRHPHLRRWQGESAADRALTEQALQQMELEGLSGRMIQTLSGGERRRLSLATLLTQDPALILLDEPLNHLDLRHQQQLLAQLGHWQARQKGIAMVLHEPNHALHYCNRVLLLYGDGRWECGAAQEMLNSTRLSQLYRCPLQESRSGGRRWFHF